MAKDVAQLTDGRWMLRWRIADAVVKIEKAPFPRANSLSLEGDLSVNLSLALVADVAQIIGNWPIVSASTFSHFSTFLYQPEIFKP